jgi:Flp pilus assembly protein TadG
MAAEFAVAAPLLVILLLVVSLGGEWLSLSGTVTAAARDAARAASLARQIGEAQTVAQNTAQGDLTGICRAGGPTTNVILIGGQGGFAGAIDLQVTVTCTADLSAFHDLGFNGGHTFTETATVPLDPFVQRTG